MNESDFEEGRIDFEMDSEMKWRGYRKQEGKRGNRGEVVYIPISSVYTSSQSDTDPEKDRETEEHDFENPMAQTAVPDIEKKKKLCINEKYYSLNRMQREKFVETNKAISVLNLLKTGNLIAVTGLPGEGKSTTVARCLECLGEAMNLPIKYIRRRHQLFNISTDYRGFVVVDGPLDRISHDPQFNIFLSHLRKYIHRIKRFRYSKVVIVIQKEVLKFLNLHYRNHTWINEFLTFDMSVPTLSQEEKRELLQGKIGNSTAEIEEIVSYDQRVYGFPDSCRRLSFCETETRDEFLKMSIEWIPCHYTHSH
ncbi:uncharacterized protein LOC125658827 isoform X2 [Ostrea edulis]|uniref:uncharacterized protein LOC125658827 isoform X2 n=1 Tax=Ostrea edulis TaxID=37623 RepID=UPI0024AEE085|nr:uncharacterized protein LOC125658827 isoform X2 [Ostrea edulis]